jgi:16S rRNA (uracil1498-N3)-methyltransferase
MPPRFHAPALRTDASFPLPPEEARHLTRVLRLRAGATVRAFDGAGREVLARVERADRSGVRLAPLEALAGEAEPSVRVTLVQAVLKTDSMDAVVRDATMLGVAVLQPVVTRRTNVSPAALARGHAVERWRRIAVAAAKQSGGAIVPVVEAPAAFMKLLARQEGQAPPLRILCVEPAMSRPGVLAPEALRRADPPRRATLAVGPEGGWTPEEIDAAAGAGFHLVRLGRRTLRADAVPAVALAVMQLVWGDL